MGGVWLLRRGFSCRWRMWLASVLICSVHYVFFAPVNVHPFTACPS